MLASGKNLNLNSDDMADIWSQGISVDNDNDPATKNISDEAPQLEDG